MLRKLFFILVVGAFFSLLGFRLYQELASKPAAAADRGAGMMGMRAAMLVDTATAEKRLFETRLEVLGELRPRASVDVMSRVSGRLQQVLVERGDPVRKDQLLAVVDDVEVQQQIQRAEAAIAVARAGVTREEATYQNLKIQTDRFRKLHQESLISTQELEDLESRLRVAAAQLELARAQVEQAAAALRELKIQQEQTRVYSPLEGFVGTRYLDPGALVNPSTPIVSVLDLSRVKTVVPVSEGVIQQIRVGLPAIIHVDAYPDQTYRGSITRISPFLNPETRTAEVEIEIGNPGRVLKPGMFARVSIDATVSSSALSIPRSALITRGNEQGVFLLDDQNRTVFRPIQIGRIKGEHVEVLSGLQEGDRMVSSGAQNLNEGDRVRTPEEAAPTRTPGPASPGRTE